MLTRTMLATALCLATVASGCGSALVQCKLEAVERLPDDPLAVNGHDVSNLIARLQNCRASAADAGAR